MGIKVSVGDGVAEVVIDYPPVNALPVQGWFDLADAVTSVGADPAVRVVILAATGRGFCAGVDIKEIQRAAADSRSAHGSTGHDVPVSGGHKAPVGASRRAYDTPTSEDNDAPEGARHGGRDAPTGEVHNAPEGAGRGGHDAPTGEVHNAPEGAGRGGYGALIGANRGCFAAFAAVYECAVPVIAAVQGFCLGGGVGLAGNADIVIAAQDAVFGLPEVDRGALGAATHLSRLVPQQLMRTMVYTCRNVPAAQLHAFGSVIDVVPTADLRFAARSLATEIAAKNGEIIRLAKQSLNGIDPIDVKRSYRYEQGFTYELNLTGISDTARQAFVDRRNG